MGDWPDFLKSHRKASTVFSFSLSCRKFEVERVKFVITSPSIHAQHIAKFMDRECVDAILGIVYQASRLTRLNSEQADFCM